VHVSLVPTLGVVKVDVDLDSLPISEQVYNGFEVVA